jgi:hypothetical protein
VLYLLDASVLITAHHHYYPIDVVPEFWSWLQHMGLQQQIKMPLEIYEEIKDGRKDREKDLLFAWIQQADSRDAILLDEEPEVGLVRQVIEQATPPTFPTRRLSNWGAIPSWLRTRSQSRTSDAS